MAGGFSTVNGQARRGLAAVDATSGALDMPYDEDIAWGHRQEEAA